MRFESEKLVEDLISGTLRTDGGLPLLQFALAELWQARDVQRQQITASALAQIGGVEGALAQHADRIVQTLLPGQRPAAQRLLIALVSVAGLRVRRSADELLLQPGDLLVVETLVRGRLLVARGQAEQTLYEIAHEALVQGWVRFANGWRARQSGARSASESKPPRPSGDALAKPLRRFGTPVACPRSAQPVWTSITCPRRPSALLRFRGSDWCATALHGSLLSWPFHSWRYRSMGLRAPRTLASGGLGWQST